MARRRPPDRLDTAVARLSILRQSDADAATAYAIELVATHHEHRVLEPALELLTAAAPAGARMALRARFADLAERGDRLDQDCSLRAGIVRALRAIDSRSDGDVAEQALRTVQLGWTGVDLAQGLRAEGLLLLAAGDPERADLFAAELLGDPHASRFSGEPTLTAIRVLARRGQFVTIWAKVRRPGLPPDVVAQAFASARSVPADLQLAALREHLDAATALGEEGEATALVVAEAIVLNELADGYPLLLDLLRETPNTNLHQYLVVTAARASDPRLRNLMDGLRKQERDERKRAVLDSALG